MGFAENLLHMRKQMGWTQIDLSIKSGINAKTLSSYENGRTEPNLGEVVKLCNVFDCSIAHLTGTKERQPGDITIEDIMYKLSTLDRQDLLRIQSHIEVLLAQQDEIIRIAREKDRLEMEKRELEEKLADYDRMLNIMKSQGVRRE